MTIYPISLEPEHDTAKLEAVRAALVSWFEENGRELPWRRTRDPWSILVSEVMLQQIQVKRAVPFYEAFLERFPTSRALAEALMPRGYGWKWGQSLIEFGAVQCTARKPLCESCPLSNLCAARPTVWGALATLPRAGKAAYRYEGSNRYYRGRVLAALREAPEGGVSLRQLGEGLREGLGEEDLPWLRGRARPGLTRAGVAAGGRRGTGGVRRRQSGSFAARDDTREPALSTRHGALV